MNDSGSVMLTSSHGCNPRLHSPDTIHIRFQEVINYVCLRTDRRKLAFSSEENNTDSQEAVIALLDFVEDPHHKPRYAVTLKDTDEKRLSPKGGQREQLH